MHLGMSGSFRVEDEPVGEFYHPRGKAPTHDHVVFEFEGGARVVYNDPRRFGFMDLVDDGGAGAPSAVRRRSASSRSGRISRRRRSAACWRARARR